MAGSDWPWSVLGIEETSNTREIQTAYAKLLKTIDQKTDLEKFQQLNQAFKIARQIAASKKADIASRPEPENVEWEETQREAETSPPAEPPLIDQSDEHSLSMDQQAPDDEWHAEDDNHSDCDTRDETKEPASAAEFQELLKLVTGLVNDSNFKPEHWLPLLNHPALDDHQNIRIFEDRIVHRLTNQDNWGQWNWADKIARSDWAKLINARFGWCDDSIGFLRRYPRARTLLESVLQSHDAKKLKDEASSQFQTATKPKPRRFRRLRFFTPSLLVSIGALSYFLRLSSLGDVSATAIGEKYEWIFGVSPVVLFILWLITCSNYALVNQIRARAPRWMKPGYVPFIPALILAAAFAVMLHSLWGEMKRNPVLAEDHIFGPGSSVRADQYNGYGIEVFKDHDELIENGQNLITAFSEAKELPQLFPVFSDRNGAFLTCDGGSWEKPDCQAIYQLDWDYLFFPVSEVSSTSSFDQVSETIDNPLIRLRFGQIVSSKGMIDFSARMGDVKSDIPLSKITLRFGDSPQQDKIYDNLGSTSISEYIDAEKLKAGKAPFELQVSDVRPGPEGVENSRCEARLMSDLGHFYGYEKSQAKSDLLRQACVIAQDDYPSVMVADCSFGSCWNIPSISPEQITDEIDLSFVPAKDAPVITELFLQIAGVATDHNRQDFFGKDKISMQIINDYRAVLGFESSSPELVSYLRGRGITEVNHGVPENEADMRLALLRQPQLIPIQRHRKELAGEIYGQLFATLRRLKLLSRSP